jgi:hypothetical protein
MIGGTVCTVCAVCAVHMYLWKHDTSRGREIKTWRLWDDCRPGRRGVLSDRAKSRTWQRRCMEKIILFHQGEAAKPIT